MFFQYYYILESCSVYQETCKVNLYWTFFRFCEIIIFMGNLLVPSVVDAWHTDNVLLSITKTIAIVTSSALHARIIRPLFSPRSCEHTSVSRIDGARWRRPFRWKTKARQSLRMRRRDRGIKATSMSPTGWPCTSSFWLRPAGSLRIHSSSRDDSGVSVQILRVVIMDRVVRDSDGHVGVTRIWEN